MIKAKRKIIVESQEDIKLNITGITLLDKIEYKKARMNVPKHDKWWWLRTGAFASKYVTNVGSDCSFHDSIVCNHDGGVRPALIFSPSSSLLHTGDKVYLWDYIWTVINEDGMMLCDSILDERRFDAESNDYETSEIKKYLENWLTKHMKR